jgi:hypothetical protein
MDEPIAEAMFIPAKCLIERVFFRDGMTVWQATFPVESEDDWQKTFGACPQLFGRGEVTYSDAGKVADAFALVGQTIEQWYGSPDSQNLPFQFSDFLKHLTHRANSKADRR